MAAVKIACDLVKEGLIDESVALKRLADYDPDSLQIMRLASEQKHPALSIGVPACPGVAVGQIALDPRVALAMAAEGRRPILVRHDISTDDLAGLSAAEDTLTRLGGRTSHAAVRSADEQGLHRRLPGPGDRGRPALPHRLRDIFRG